MFFFPMQWGCASTARVNCSLFFLGVSIVYTRLIRLSSRGGLFMVYGACSGLADVRNSLFSRPLESRSARPVVCGEDRISTPPLSSTSYIKQAAKLCSAGTVPLYGGKNEIGWSWILNIDWWHCSGFQTAMGDSSIHVVLHGWRNVSLYS